MRTLSALVALAALLAFVPLAHANAATVTLELTGVSFLAPGAVSCDVSVPLGANGGDVLDAAVASGCISSWEHVSFEGFGRQVTCIDGVCQQADGLATFWEFVENGHVAGHGIDGYSAAAGDHVKFAYTNFEVDFTLSGLGLS